MLHQWGWFNVSYKKIFGQFSCFFNTQLLLSAIFISCFISVVIWQCPQQPNYTHTVTQVSTTVPIHVRMALRNTAALLLDATLPKELHRIQNLKFIHNMRISTEVQWFLNLLKPNAYVVGSKSFRPDIQNPRQMQNAVRDIQCHLWWG